MNSIKYACTALVGTNKAGVIKCDEHGYYRLVVGALNFSNAADIYYEYESSKHVFESSSSFMRRISGGNLYAEEDHPQWTTDLSLDDYVMRIKRIDPDRVCAHIREIEVVKEERGEYGRDVYVIYAHIKPDRERGKHLKAALDNPKQNVCFSLRALVDDRVVAGRRMRTITDLITFDWVIEPGISKANKFSNPALESFSHDHVMEIPMSAVVNAVQRSRTSGLGFGMESDTVLDLERVIAHHRNNQPRTVIAKPAVCGRIFRR